MKEKTPIGFIASVDGRPIVPVFSWNDDDCWGVLNECRMRNVVDDLGDRCESWREALDSFTSDWRQAAEELKDTDEDLGKLDENAAWNELPQPLPPDGPCIRHGLVADKDVPGSRMDGYALLIELL